MDNNNSPRKNTESDDLFLDIARARHENAAHIREEATRQIPVVHRGASKSARNRQAQSCIAGRDTRKKRRSECSSRSEYRSAHHSAAAGSRLTPCTVGTELRHARTAAGCPDHRI